jgi:hypothetical protein
MPKLSALALGCAFALAMAAPVGPMRLRPDVAQARSSCLTIDRAGVRIDGRLSAAGRESVFEHRVVVNVRGANGRVIADTAVTGRDGSWNVTLFVLSPRDQTGTLEVLSRSPKDGSIACLARRQVRLPFTSPVAQRLVYRAKADVDGDGRGDVIALRKTSHAKGVIEVALASGRHVSATTRSLAVGRPGLVRVGNVNGRAGSELFVELEHISTAGTIGIYTYANRQLRLAGTLPTSAHAGLFSGITCGSCGSEHFITAHSFVLQPQTGPPRYWTRTDSRYAWHGAKIVLAHKGATIRISGTPSPGRVGVRCGHAPVGVRVGSTAAGGVIRPWRWGINYLGSWHVGAKGNGTYSAAVRALGKPNSVTRVGGGTCTARWRGLGLTIRFTTFGKATGCSGLFAQDGSITTDAGHRHWRTAKRLRVGDSLAKLDRLYPKAIRLKGSRVIAYERHSPYSTGRLDLITAQITRGRVSAFQLFIGAAGD